MCARPPVRVRGDMKEHTALQHAAKHNARFCMHARATNCNHVRATNCNHNADPTHMVRQMYGSRLQPNGSLDGSAKGRIPICIPASPGACSQPRPRRGGGRRIGSCCKNSRVLPRAACTPCTAACGRAAPPAACCPAHAKRPKHRQEAAAEVQDPLTQV